MDLLQQCAQEFDRLTAYQYHFVVGRKGKRLEFTISFEQADFHHLAGLHKLRDNANFLTGLRANILKDILAGKITYEQAARSTYFSTMASRLRPLAHLEKFLDSNEIIFRYNARVQKFSVILADYLLQNDFEEAPVYLFLSQRTGQDTYVCQTFFPKVKKDYAEGQPRYTLLKKEKTNLVTGETIVQYDRLTPKEPKKEEGREDA